MALLSVQQRSQVWRGLMRRWSATHETPSAAFNKFDIYNPTANTGVVADVDSWIDTRTGNTAPDTVGFNGSLAVAMRTALSATMKTDSFVGVAAMRQGPDYVRSLFGDID